VARDVTFNEFDFYFKSKLTSESECADRNETAGAPTVPLGQFFTPDQRDQHPEEDEFDVGYFSDQPSVSLEGHASPPQMEHIETDSSQTSSSDQHSHQSGGRGELLSHFGCWVTSSLEPMMRRFTWPEGITSFASEVQVLDGLEGQLLITNPTDQNQEFRFDQMGEPLARLIRVSAQP
ncbi:hypothetical protein LINGRAHAP2_LOCUS11315, partial [Linum grandiflorum]